MENLVKKIAALAFMFLITQALTAQIEFYRGYSGNGYDRGYGVAQLLDSGYLVTGASSSFEEAPAQAFLLRLDKNGDFVWSRAYGGPEFEEGRRILPLEGYGNFIAGTSNSGPSADFDAYLIFTTDNGEFQWSVYSDNGAWERVHDAILMPDTTIVIVGETSANSDENKDMFAIRYDKTGNEIWRQQWGTSGEDELNAIYQVSDTTFLLAGMMYNEDSLQTKGYLAKMHLDGSVLWNKQLGVNGNYELNDVTVSAGTIKAVGQRIQTGYEDFDSYFAILDPFGTLLYAEENHMDYQSRFTHIAPIYGPSASLYHAISDQAINPSILTFTDSEDAYLSLFDSGLFWAGSGSNYSNYGMDEIGDIQKTLDSLAVAVGYHSALGPGGNTVFVVKIGQWSLFPINNGTVTITNIVTTQELQELADLQVFPNPMQDILIISLPETDFSYELVDASGRLLDSGKQWATTQIDVSNQPQGAYFLRISHESGETVTMKLVK